MEKYLKDRIAKFATNIVLEVQEKTALIGDISKEFALVASKNIIAREQQLRDLPQLDSVPHSNELYTILLNNVMSKEYVNYYTDKLIYKLGDFKKSFETLSTIEKRLNKEDVTSEPKVTFSIYGNTKLYNVIKEELQDYPQRGYIQNEPPVNAEDLYEYLVENNVISNFSAEYLKSNRATPDEYRLQSYYDYVQDLINLIHYEVPNNIKVRTLEFKKMIVTRLYKELNIFLSMNTVNKQATKIFRNIRKNEDEFELVVYEKAWEVSTPTDILSIAHHANASTLSIAQFKDSHDTVLAKAKTDKLTYLRRRRESAIIRKGDYIKRRTLENDEFSKTEAIKALLEGKSNKDVALCLYNNKSVEYFYNARRRYGYAEDEHNKTIEVLGYIITYLLYELHNN